MAKQFYVGDVACFLASNEGGREFLVDVKVLEVQKAFGTFRYRITPISGKGEMWVENLVEKK